MIKLEDFNKQKFELSKNFTSSIFGGGTGLIRSTGTEYMTDKTNSDGSVECGGDTEWEGKDTCFPIF